MNTNAVKPVRHGDQIEVEISSLAFGGDAVGRFQDFAIFVPGGLPGERVRVKITQVKDSYATAEILSILRHSPDRVAPTCAIFEECGGCQWQHQGYPSQLKTKRQFVVDALQRIGHLSNVTVQPCLPSPSPYAYRNKAMPVVSMRDGHFISGIYEPRSHHLVPYHTCPIQGDPINDLIQRVLKKIDRSALTPYQEKKHLGFLRHLAVRQGVKTGELLLAFVTRTEVPEDLHQKPTLIPEERDQILPRIARELMSEVPGLVGVLQNVNASRTNIVFGPTTNVLEGRDHYFEIIDDLKLKVSLKSFLQVNTRQADILHAIVREALGEPVHKKKWGTVLDLYSGIGTLSLAVADKADYVVGIEEVAPAVEDARVNAELNQKTNIDYLEGDVAHVLLGLKEKGLTQMDAAILDPPRKGVLPEVLARLTAFHPERLVYVSCDPSTLARDLALLAKHGFAVDWVQPLDMFPQTYHVETVVKLTRETPLPPEVQTLPGAPQMEPFRLTKPVEPSSLNISASFTAFKEKTAALSQAVGQQGSAVLDLVRSIFSTCFALIAGSLAALSRGVVRLFQFTGRSSAQAGEKLKGIVRETSAGVEQLTHSGARTSGQVLLSFRERAASLKRRIVSALSVKIKTRQVPMSPPAAKVETRPTEYPETGAASGLNPEEVLLLSTPLEVSSFPETPALTPGEKPLDRLGEAFPPIEKPFSRPVPSPWLRKSPPLSVPGEGLLGWFSVHKRLVWVLIAAFLAGGGYVAKATLSPESKRSSVLVPTVSQMIPDVIAVMPTRNFLRYELVPFEVRVNPEEMPSFSQMNATVEVYRGGNPVTMVDGRSKLNLKRDTAAGRFVGNWPIPYNPAPGTYTAAVIVSAPEWASPKVFESAFTLSALKPSGLFPGYSVLTMEGGKQLIGGAVPALDGGERMTSSNAIDWAKFMGANVYCYLMGQTSIWGELRPKEFPFNRRDMEVGRKYAKAAHASGLKFAAYMTTFKVIGDAWQQATYDFALGYDPDSDEVIQTRFISLNDAKRRQDIIAFMKEMEKDPEIDMVGMDYVRTGFGGYEMVDEFVKDLNVPGPANFWSMTQQERIHWLARTVDMKESREVVALFEWWRAHKVALSLKEILDEAKMTKPVFTFTLGWQMGHQHGQDPAMFVDAGVDYNHIMLYEGDRNTMESMKRQWPDYLTRANGMYAMGEMVDFNLVQKSLDPPGPEELYNRQVETFRGWYPVNASVGMFWHDLYRIIYGIRGPYSSMEWAIAGGKAFSVLQHAQGLTPIEVSLKAPRNIPAGVPVPISVEITNRSPENLKGMVLHQLDTSKNYYVDLATVGPFDLAAGSMVKVKSLFVNIPREDQPERDNRYMAAVMVEKPGQPYRAFDFAYLKKVPTSAVIKHMDVSQEDGASNSETSGDPSRGLEKGKR
jgi:23S rRNA (uracil1939-C5)-methyltransferase